MKRVPALLVLLASVACASTQRSAGLGSYDEFRPYATLRSFTVADLELSRPAYVAIVGITIPAPGYAERPVVFQPIYPRWDTDKTHFAAGRHRIVSARRTLRDPANCRGTEKPTLSGCRKRLYQYPEAGAHNEVGRIYVADAGHYVVIASEEFVDPYLLAEDLFFLAFEREELAAALKSRKVHEAASDLERALSDRPGSPIWGALYVGGR